MGAIVHMPQALLFDVDGTLADTEGDGHRPAFNATFAAHGLPWHWDRERYRHLLAEVPGGRERIVYELRRNPPTTPLPEPLETFAETLHQEKNQRYAEIVRSGAIRPRMGILRLIAEAHAAGTALAIVTTSARRNVTALLEHAFPPALQGVFTVMVCGEDVAAKKPDPEAYRLALEQLGLPAAACLAVEDSVNGLRSARAAGLATLVTRNEWSAGDDFSGALAVVDHLDERGDGHPVTLEWLAAALAATS
ncbi:phosphatase [Halorhodospira abdelmalekii]|uniref:HAD-IA family hydrolase n=1 Tax=Halorhodospira abdelmalekii TaxID=421629 RepID=UPI0019065256|nr:HAD-IA family hydrolase [Halorhodospira abdelmalekii]MBK1735078.1 phosphatase [Halorhodospira abdelmalekii]